MKTRCVHIFPQFENISEIEAIREAYDNLFGLVAPHITIVFPFESALTNEQISEEIHKQISDFSPFKLTLKGFSKKVDRYGSFLFLDVVEGMDEIIKLHYKMHEGILKPYHSPWTLDGSYLPHMTVGRFKESLALDEAFEKVRGIPTSFSTTVNQVVVEIIGAHEESIIESTVVFSYV